MDGQEIVNFVTTTESRTTALRERMENSFDLWRLEDVPWGDVESYVKKEYRTMTTNRPRVFADKITDELASGTFKDSIPQYKEGKGERANISMTEQCAVGLIAQADKNNIAQGLPTVQGQWAFTGTLRGGLVTVPWISQKKVRGGPKLFVDVAVWDAFTTYWEPSIDGLLHCANVRYIARSALEDVYGTGLNLTEDQMGRVKTIVFLDREVQKVVIGTEVVGKVLRHKRHHVPALIIPVGASFPLNSNNHDDLWKHWGSDFADKNRYIWPRESELLSYQLTTAKEGSRPTLVVEFDGPANQPIIPASPWTQGAHLNLDLSKKQNVRPLFNPMLPKEVFALQDQLGSLNSEGSAAPIFYGRSSGTSTAQEAALLIHSAMGTLKNGKTAMETSRAWTCNELVSWYKDGKFAEVELQGVDNKKVRFAITPQKDKLVTNRDFISELSIDYPQDMMQNVDIAEKLLNLRLLSRQTAADKYAQVPDTDAEFAKRSSEDVDAAIGGDLITALEAALKDRPMNAMLVKILHGAIQQKLDQAEAMMQPAPAAPAGPISTIGGMKPIKMKAPAPGMPAPGNPTGSVASRLGALGLVSGGR